MNLYPKPGATVVTDFGSYQHYSIVSNRTGNDGMPMLVSHTQRNDSVQEEEWSIVTQGRHTKLSNIQGNLSGHEVLRRARSQINQIKYQILNFNCEHFARLAHGLPVESKQVVGGVAGVGLGYAVAKSFGAKPVASILTVLALGAIGVSMMKEA